jgi:hypothetical protein
MIDERLDAIGRHPFRAKFHLCGRERAEVTLHGMSTIRAQARDLITRRVAPAEPHRDGRQTPWRGHPVFVAQHATGTCCRSCLQRLHEIPKGHPLAPEELNYVVDVICRWIEREMESPGRRSAA